MPRTSEQMRTEHERRPPGRRDGARTPPGPAPGPRPRRRGSRAQRGGGPGAVRPAPPRPPARHLPVRLPHHRRRQRQYRPHPADRRAPRVGTARGGVDRAARQGARPGAARRLVAVVRAGPRLPRRRPLHRPRGPAPAGRTADIGALRHRHRHPPGPRRPGRARPETGDHLPLLQRAAALDARGALLRRPVRLQGGAPRRRGAAAAPGPGLRLVLRHRTPRHRRTRRAAHPRGARRLGRRPRQPGAHPPDRAGRPPGHRPRRPRARHRPAPPHRTAPRLRGHRGPGPAPLPTAALRSRRRRQHPRLPAALRGAAAARRPPGRQRPGAADLRRREHRRQPAPHLRPARPLRRRTAPRARAAGLPRRPRAHQRRAGRPAPHGTGRRPPGRTRGARRRQPGRHAPSLPAPPVLGLPRPARPRTEPTPS